MKNVIFVMSVSALTLFAGAALAQQAYKFEDVVHLTCEEVALQVGENADRLGAIVQPLAEYSLAKRKLVIPEGRPELGPQFGDLLKAFCTAEPDSLLYNAVDRAIRRLPL